MKYKAWLIDNIEAILWLLEHDLTVTLNDTVVYGDEKV